MSISAFLIELKKNVFGRKLEKMSFLRKKFKEQKLFMWLGEQMLFVGSLSRKLRGGTRNTLPPQYLSKDHDSTGSSNLERCLEDSPAIKCEKSF
jgi:hypothetical protein